jgi:hypothetical protein
VTVLEDLLPDVDPETPVCLIVWMRHDGEFSYVWQGCDPQGADDMLVGVLRHVRHKYGSPPDDEPSPTRH